MIPPGFSIEKPANAANQPTTKVAGVPMDQLPPARQRQFSDQNTSHLYGRFQGFFLVETPEEPRHVRFAMDVTLPSSKSLQTRSMKRFHHYIDLRTNLLKAFKTSHLTSSSTFFSSTKPCEGCSRMKNAIKEAPFPKRKLLYVGMEDLCDRAEALQTFLHTCVQCLKRWDGCEEGKAACATVFGQFLGVMFYCQPHATTMSEAKRNSMGEERSSCDTQLTGDDLQGKTVDAHAVTHPESILATFAYEVDEDEDEESSHLLRRRKAPK